MPLFPETRRVQSLIPWINTGAISTASHSILLNHGSSTMTTATNWSTANRAIYVPVIIPEQVTIRQLGWYNGTTAASNVDAGIYDEYNTLIVSTGSTAQTGPGVSVWQFVDITDTQVGPGLFYFALAMNGTSRVAIIVAGGTGVAQMFGCAMQATAFALPATATPAVITTAHIPLVVALLNTAA